MSMFTHVTVGTNDPDKARAFYDAVFGALGIPGQHTPERGVVRRSRPEAASGAVLRGNAAQRSSRHATRTAGRSASRPRAPSRSTPGTAAGMATWRQRRGAARAARAGA
jgi:catechol 2,3-dioxygenase-like lactoylglutathione lyase family enzyme